MRLGTSSEKEADEWDRTARLPQMAVMSVSKRAKRPRDNAPTTVQFKYADQ